MLKFDRIIDTYFSSLGRGFEFFFHSAPLWFKKKIFQSSEISESLLKLDSNWNRSLLYSEHHISHAASCFYPSSFDKSLVLVNDGVGEWETTTVFIGSGSELRKIKSIHFPNSIGLLYSTFTSYLGFRVNHGEYKVMGLAPYGSPKYTEIILNKICTINDDGSYCLNMKYFSFRNNLTMFNKKFEKLFKNRKRTSDDPITQFHMDIAASIQDVTEQLVINILNQIHKEFKIDNLCMAGGVALNCVLNGKVLKETPFKNLWIQPAAGDAGSCIGAALYCHYKLSKQERILDANYMQGSYLGNQFSDHEVESFLIDREIKFTKISACDLLCEKIAKKIEEGNIIGWFQGRSEFGPRALGNRSILADPRVASTQRKVNIKIKFRESFRPFAPVIMEEYLSDWFELKTPTPFMLMTAQVNPAKIKPCHYQTDSDFISSDKFISENKWPSFKSDIGAVTHVNRSARIQTTNKNSNPLLYNLLAEFNKLTKTPILLNTSFNTNNMPIVDSPQDAYDCFMSTNLDLLVINNYIVDKNDCKTN